MLMTMEMWWLGFYMNRFYLALLLTINIPLLVGLSHYSGFETTFGWLDDLVDAFVAYAVGFVMALVVLPLIGEIGAGTSLDEVVGKVALQTIPGSMGALLARSQFIRSREDEGEQQQDQQAHPSYWGELFLVVVGALFLSLNLAPTEEMILVTYKMMWWQAILLALASMVIMHGFVYAVQFQGQHEDHPDSWLGSAFLHFTIPSYALVLLVSLFVMGVFGRLYGTALEEVLTLCIVLGFPGAIGGAAARLLL
jgi:putative integral membrane protein (TIGR02587 family)